MKKIITPFLLLLFSYSCLFSQKQLVVVGTGFGFDANASNGVNPEVWTYFSRWANLTSNGQDASPTAFRLHIQWAAYEPTPGVYKGAKLAQAVAAILALKPGLKIALHFPYSRHGPSQEQYPGFLADSEIARIPDGTKVEKDLEITGASMYSASAKTKFFNFVNDALSHLTAYYSNILYVELGNGEAEEFVMPMLQKNGYHYTGMYEDAALAAWRTEYLPCRYPGQSTVTWSGNTFNIATAPAYDPGQWGDYSSEHGREYHRFASWGLMKMYKEFYTAVKSHSNNLKVLMFQSGFGTSAGNIQSMHNSILPKSLSDLDGIYTTEGDGYETNWRKIMALDVMKGTDPSKLTGVEFDFYDLGATVNSSNRPHWVNVNVANEWMPRAYKHGADYVHIAMTIFDEEMDILAPVVAALRPVYLNGSYTPPSRQAAPGTTNIYPNSFTGNTLFDAAWNNQSGNNWASTDLNPKSVNMIDDGYWQNIWSCSTTPPPCDFNITATGPTGSVPTSTSVTLTANCTGQCSGITYTWSGNGISGTGTTKTFTSPGSAGMYTYTVTASKSGCTNKTATYQLSVGTPCDFAVTASANPSSVAPSGPTALSYVCTGANCSGVTYAWSGNGISGSGTPKNINAPGTVGTYTYMVTASKSGCADKTATAPVTVFTGSGCIVNKVRLFFRGAGDCCMERLPGAKIQGSANGGSTWTDLYTFTTNGAGAFQDFTFSNSTPYTSARFVASSTGWGELRELEFYNGTTKLTGTTFGTDSYANAFDGNTATEWHAPTTPGPNNYAGLNFTGCTTPTCDFNVSATATPSTVNVSGAVALSYACTGANCSGVSYAWSGNGASGSANPTNVTAPSVVGSYTYTITASKATCTSKTATATVTTTSNTFNQCLESESSNGNGSVSGDPNASNGQTRGDEGTYNHYVDYMVTSVPVAGTYYAKLRYYSSSAPVVAVSVNGGTVQTVNLANSLSWNITWTEQTITVTLPAGSSTIRILGSGGGSCRQDRICVSNSPSYPAMLNPVNPDEVNLNMNKKLLVSPNPGRGIFQAKFYLEKGTKATIVVTDIQGRTVHLQNITGQGQHNEKIDLTNKASGMLFMRLQRINGAEVKKLNIVR